MATINATASLTGVSQTVVHEKTTDTVNRLPVMSGTPVVNFFHGIHVMEGSDTTFSTSAPWTVTFAATAIGSVLVGQRAHVIDGLGRAWFGDITAVNAGSRVITVSAWELNETDPSAALVAPSDSSRTIVNHSAPQLSYTIGTDVYAPPGAVRYSTSQTITFDAYASFPLPRYASSFKWDMGDGTILTGSTISHTYRSPATFRRVILRVIDDLGHEYVVGQQIYVLLPVPLAPGPHWQKVPTFTDDPGWTDTSTYFLQDSSVPDAPFGFSEPSVQNHWAMEYRDDALMPADCQIICQVWTTVGNSGSASGALFYDAISGAWARVYATGSALDFRSYVAFVTSSGASSGTIRADGVAYNRWTWLRVRKTGNILSLDAFTADPRIGSTTSFYTQSFTLTGTDVTDLGTGKQLYPGFAINAGDRANLDAFESGPQY